MKWFKHDTDASIDAKLQGLLLDYGAVGYGLYWYCVELIAKDVTPKNITFELEHDARIIARNLNLSVKEVNDIMTKIVELGLFDISKNNKIACVKLAYRLDDSMRKGRVTEEIINAFNRENPEQVGKIPNDSGKSLPDIDKELDTDTEEETEEKESRKKQTFSQWMESVKSSGQKPLPKDHYIFEYIESVGLPEYYIYLSWLAFTDRYRQEDKKYTDWRKVFANSVKNNWFKLWWLSDNGFALTTIGKQWELVSNSKGEVNG